MKKLLNKITKRRGFTLVEMMIVIVIIGILSSIGIPRFRTVITRSKVVEFKPIIEQLCVLEENYHAENDKYTDDLDDIGFDDPKAKYFTFSVEADSLTFIAIATCNVNLKGRDGADLKGQRVTIDNEQEHGGDPALRRIAGW